MDKNTPDLLSLTPPSFLSLSKANPHRDELLGGAPPGRIRRARHRPPPRVRRPPGRGHPELAGCHPNNQRRGRGGALVEGGARRRRRGSCAAARPAACPGWISPSRHGRPPGRREGEGTQGGGAVPAAARLGASVGRPPRAGPPLLCPTTGRRPLSSSSCQPAVSSPRPPHWSAGEEGREP